MKKICRVNVLLVTSITVKDKYISYVILENTIVILLSLLCILKIHLYEINGSNS